MSNKIFIFLGPPGSGKGTLSALCMQQFGWELLSTGNLCRDHIARGTELGKEIQRFSNQGLLVPDEIITELVADWLLTKQQLSADVIFDGYPRTLEQARSLYLLLQTKLKLFGVCLVKIDIDAKLLVDRILNRVICSNKECGHTYSLKSVSDLQAKNNMICDHCNSKLEHRADDTVESLEQRLKVYYQHEQNIIDFYVDKGIEVCMISSAQPKQQVFEDFKNMALNNYGC
ncbi:nucleoside monophosphate kinase [Candidatus Dependentiae bacterium]|nr:nucleoside monophosphate kinase [Candidatus Dependentiae bacterium]